MKVVKIEDSIIATTLFALLDLVLSQFNQPKSNERCSYIW